jgi:uncharacterized protein YgiM (DUF1202 family)
MKTNTRFFSHHRVRRVLIHLVLMLALLMLSSPAVSAAPLSQSSSVTGIRAVVGVDGATLIVGEPELSTTHLPIGAHMTALARSADSNLLQVVTEQGVEGWLAAADVIGFGLNRLPVSDATVPGTTETTAVGAPAMSVSTVAEANDDGLTALLTTTAPLNPSGLQQIEPVSGVDVGEGQSGTNATVVTGQARLNVRSGPGETYPVIAKAVTGEQLRVIGRSADTGWLAIQRSDLPEKGGWIAARYVTLTADVNTLPVIPAQDTPPQSRPAESTLATTSTAPAPTTEQTNVSSQQTAFPIGLSGNLVFQDGKGNIYVYALASGVLRWLTNGYSPDVSANGAKVVFTRTGEENGIWAINLDGSDEHKVYSGSDLITSPKWSPDGQWIVFSRLSGVSKCYQMGPGCITLHEIQAQFPQMSPEMIYDRFLKDATRVESPLWGIARVAADGTNYRDIPSLNSAHAPDWSAAGIVYQSSVGLEITSDTADAVSQSIFHGAWDWDPDWQRDGGAIVYQENAGSHWEVWRVNPDGNGRVALTRPASVLVDSNVEQCCAGLQP